jgi:hypothetical protein
MSQGSPTAFTTSVYFFNDSPERLIDRGVIIGAVVDLHCVMIHFNATIGTDHLCVSHRYDP